MDSIDYSATTSIKQMAAKRFNLAASRAISLREIAALAADNLRLEARIDRSLDTMVLELRTWILAGEHPSRYQEFRVPKTWWQHFKLEVFPWWLLHRFPVQYDISQIEVHGPTYVCPHANQKWPDTQHIRFMCQDQLAHPIDWTGGPC